MTPAQTPPHQHTARRSAAGLLNLAVFLAGVV
jgi:hypothetical protein